MQTVTENVNHPTEVMNKYEKSDLPENKDCFIQIQPLLAHAH